MTKNKTETITARTRVTYLSAEEARAFIAAAAGNGTLLLWFQAAAETGKRFEDINEGDLLLAALKLSGGVVGHS